jgi:cytochrome c-L
MLGINKSSRTIAPHSLVLAAAFVIGAASVAGAGTASKPQDATPVASESGEPLEFIDVFGSPLDVGEPRPDETFSEEVMEFHRTGENPYVDDEEAIEEGAKLYNSTCRGCHGKEASGGMGPSLVDEAVANERVTAHKGLFEVIYGGASGAMQAFGTRLDQAEILKIMAYVDSLRQED